MIAERSGPPQHWDVIHWHLGDGNVMRLVLPSPMTKQERGRLIKYLELLVEEKAISVGLRDEPTEAIAEGG